MELQLGQDNPIYVYRLGEELIECSPSENDLGGLGEQKVGHEPAVLVCSPEGQLYPGLHQNRVS